MKTINPSRFVFGGQLMGLILSYIIIPGTITHFYPFMMAHIALLLFGITVDIFFEKTRTGVKIRNEKK